MAHRTRAESVAWVPVPSKVFGVSLSDIERDNPKQLAPTFLRKAIKHLNKYALHEVGLFQQPANQQALDGLKQGIELGIVSDYERGEGGVHVVAHLVKAFLRELTEPLFPFSCFDTAVATQGIVDPLARCQAIRELIRKLPNVNKAIMQLVVFFLSRLTDYAPETGLTSDVLAVIFAPITIYPSRAAPPPPQFAYQSAVGLFRDLLDQCEFILDVPGADTLKVPGTILEIPTTPLGPGPSTPSGPGPSLENSLPEEVAPPVIESAPVRRLLAQVTSETPDWVVFEKELVDPNFDALTAIMDVAPTTALEEITVPMVEVMESRTRALDYLQWAISREINATSTEQTLFRGNSLATKSMVAYAKMNGGNYLIETFASVLVLLKESCATHDYEISALKVKSKKKLQANVDQLTFMTQLFFDSVLTSVHNVPYQFRYICHILHTTVGEKFPGARHQVIGAFFFLRFLCPALLQPAQFGLADEDLSTPKMQRPLILVSKTLQNLANGILFSDAKPEMLPMNAFLNANMQSINYFFDELATLPKRDPARRGPLYQPVLIDSARLSKNLEHLQRWLKGFVPPLEATVADLMKKEAAVSQKVVATAEPVFGASLTALAQKAVPTVSTAAADLQLGNPAVPNVLRECLGLLDAQVTTEELFKKAPALYLLKDVREIKERFNRGPTRLDPATNPHVTAAIVKQYFLELPEPLISDELRDEFTSDPPPNPLDRLNRIRAALPRLPPAHRVVLHVTCALLSKVARASATNFMDSAALSLVFAPLWQRQRAVVGSELIGRGNAAVQYLIEYFDFMFLNGELPVNFELSEPRMERPRVASTVADKEQEAQRFKKMVMMKDGIRGTMGDVELQLRHLRRELDAAQTQEAINALDRKIRKIQQFLAEL